MAEHPPAVEELLAHTDWLTQLARALVGDAAADDVVQETLVVALAKPPTRGGPLRPWLGGVARNVARMATRGRVRREKREHTVAGEPVPDVPTPEELVARVELQHRVAKLVLELPEPLRGTLLLRYVEGLDASEIARAQGIPAGTVRSRIKDGLDRVRASLDAEHGGDRRRWVAVLAPPLAAVPGGTAALVGGLLVKTSLKIALGIVIAAVLLLASRLAGLWGGGDGEAARSPAAVVAKPVSAPTPVSGEARAPAPSTRALPSFHDDDPEGTLRLEGQVIDEREAPVAGARVAIDTNPPRVVETEADGAFVFTGLSPRDYQLEAAAGELYAGPARLRLTDDAEPVTLRMRRGGSVEVTVTEREGGAAVQGAVVELRSTLVWSATTDASGVARLRGVGAVWAPLAARADGFAPAAMMISTAGAADVTERVAIRLSRGPALAGRVVDETGAPVAGARVVPAPASEPLPVVDPRRDGVVTRADGRFTIPAVAPGTWRLTATHRDHAPTTTDPIAVAGERVRDDVEIVLARGAVVRGVVKERSGQPVAAADVSVVAQGFVAWRARRQVFTDADGRFELRGLPRRAVDVVAQHARGSSPIASVDLAARREHEVELVLDHGGTIAGVVVDEAGTPVGDAPVVVEPEWSGGTEDLVAWTVRGVQHAVTDQGGSFAFSGLPDGAYRLRAARPGAPVSALDLARSVSARPGGEPVRIVIPADGRIVGKVAFADGSAPSSFHAALGWARAVPFASDDGAFELVAQAGPHTLTISGLGFVETRREVVVTGGAKTDVGTIVVAAGRSISGRVLDARGVPVEKAKVVAGSLLTGGGSELYVPDESIGARDTETDGDGRFVLAGFSTTAVTVVAGKDGVGRSASIRIPPGTDSATLDLVLAPTTGLDGTITRDGKPVADTIVIAQPVGATGSNFFVATGPDGSFAIDSLAPGAYVVYPMLGGGGGSPKDMYTQRVEVALGARAKATIDATPGPITLAIQVETDAGAAVPMAGVGAIGAHIDVRSVDDMRNYTFLHRGNEVIPIYMRVAVNGAVEIAGARPGAHTVCAMFGNPADPSTRFACTHVTLEARTAKQTVKLAVPASWFEKP